ncbi:MAG: hypothetical protein IJD13_07285, partial [Oscillospiraceae bacterium]|nr:hypothetical protein [Oscillospiraceae bacterium]
MKKISLGGRWTLSGRPEQTDAELIRLDAEVPGLVQLDLSAAGILPKDLFMGMNIKETEKYEDWEWWYERTFTAPDERENVFIVFRGVDCIAEYFLNGVKFGESANMFIPFEFEVGHLLRDGENTLTVHISSPVVAAHKDTYDLFAIDVARRRTPVNTSVRRAIHSYGWDIMPRAVTHGIWRDVYLEVRDKIRFTQVFFDFSRMERPRFCFETESQWKDFRDVEIEVSASCGESSFSFRKKIPYKSGMFDFELRDPKLWWPLGYGEQNLYDAVLKIYSEGKPVHEYHTRFGVRTVQLQRTDVTDGENGYFRFLVNGVEIMCKGSNWVPLDAFHSRDASRYAEALAMAKDLGCNILRCWGGNVYEDHAFFDFCDENGIMIWQDFAMACYTYPQRESFYEKIREEAASVVREYRHHPSIILWSGDNEVDYAYMTGRDTRPSMNRVTREVLPEAVRVNDIGRPYLTGSPYVDDRLAEQKGITASEAHLWGARDYYKADFYK